MEHSFQKAEED